MFNFKFGIVWLTFTNIIIFLFMNPFSGREGMTLEPIPLVLLIFFEIIGLVMLITGLITIIKDKRTKKYGRECYGIIRDIMPTGSYVNSYPEYKVSIDIVNPETYQVDTLEEIIGFDYNKYPINSYVLCKYYENDVNLLDVVSGKNIPSDVKKSLVPIKQKADYTDLEFSPDKEFVVIDGVTYRRSD